MSVRKSTTILLFFFHVAFLSFVVVSCSTDPNNKTCESDSDCSTTMKCNQGTCTARVRCTPANAKEVCAFGEICKNGVCVDKGSTKPAKECEGNLDCPNSKYCAIDSGKCVECLVDSNCSQDFRCENFRCTNEPEDKGDAGEDKDEDSGSRCNSDADCLHLTDHKCDLISNRCTPRGGIVCKTDAQCPGDQQCKSDKKCDYPRRTCQTSGDCHDGYTCINGGCYPGTCRDDRDCPGDSTCDTTTKKCSGGSQGCGSTGCGAGQRCNTTTGKCEAIAKACSKKSDCAANENCDTFTNQCVPIGGCTHDNHCKTGEECNLTTKKCEKSKPCRTNADCPSGQACMASGKCEVGCAADSDCKNGERCNLTTRQCVPLTCSKNSDCQAPNGTCRSGKCQSCVTHFSCMSSATCNRTTGICSSSCLNDGNCSSPNGTCRSGKCQSCASDFTCSTGFICNRNTGKCENSSSSTTCNQDWDCFMGEHCRKNKCIDMECGFGNRKCKSGESCVRNECVKSSSGGFCVSDTNCLNSEFCDEDSLTCTKKQCGSGASGKCTASEVCLRYECKSVSNLTRRSCLRNSDCATASHCVDRKCFSTCTNPGSKCGSTGMDCIEVETTNGKASYCFFPPNKKDGESATLGDYDQRCVVGTSYIIPNLTSTSGRCWQTCTGANDTSCPGSRECAEYNVGEWACLSKGSRKEDSSCRISTSRCSAGLYCAFDKDTDSYGKCVKKCTSDSGCTSGKTCQHLYSPKANFKTCLVKRTKTAGSLCSAVTDPCGSGLNCVNLTSSTTGISTQRCLEICNTDADCSTTYPKCYPQGVCFR